MFQLRRSAQRLLSNPSTSLTVRSRSITSISRPLFKTYRQTTLVPTLQRRWASEEVRQDEEKPESEVSDAAPIEKVEPSPQEEIDDVIQQDSKPSEASAGPSKTLGAMFDSATETVKNAANSFQSRAGDARPQNSTVYVGNLFFDVSEQDLNNEFGRFGEVKAVNLIRDGRGLSRGFGYVSFENVEDAVRAKEEMDQSIYEGRRITIQFAERRIGARTTTGGTVNPPSKTLFIGNMSFEMTDRDLNSLFKGIKNVIDVRVAIDRRTGQPRGFAHADFLDTQSAVEAFKVLKDKEVYGRRLRVDYSATTTRANRDSRDAPQ